MLSESQYKETNQQLKEDDEAADASNFVNMLRKVWDEHDNKLVDKDYERRLQKSLIIDVFKVLQEIAASITQFN